MRKEYLQPFLRASQDVSEKYFGVEVEKSDITLEKTLYMQKDVIVALGIKGDLSGVVLFGLTREDADKLSGHVLQAQGLTKEQAEQMGISEAEWVEMNESVLKEYGNQVVGYVTQLYGNEGFQTDITTPSFITSKQLENYNKDSIKFEMKNKLANMIVKLHIQKN